MRVCMCVRLTTSTDAVIARCAFEKTSHKEAALSAFITITFSVGVCVKRCMMHYLRIAFFNGVRNLCLRRAMQRVATHRCHDSAWPADAEQMAQVVAVHRSCCSRL